MMDRRILLFIFGIIFISREAPSVRAEDILWEDISRGISGVHTVVIAPGDDKIILIGTKQGIYKSSNAGVTWMLVLALQGSRSSVYHISFDKTKDHIAYAATDKGVYVSFDAGEQWMLIFKGSHSPVRQCRICSAKGEDIYIGTEEGMWVSRDSGKRWEKISGLGSHSTVYAIDFVIHQPHSIYAASSRGVFRSHDNGVSWERVFFLSPRNEEADEYDDNGDSTQEIKRISIQIVADIMCEGHLYCATTGAVFESRDSGDTWDRLPRYGLFGKEIKFLYLSSLSELYVVTQSGIFKLGEGRWHEISLRLSAQDVTSLAIDNDNVIYATSALGVHRGGRVFTAGGRDLSLWDEIIQNEPSISQVQQEAIRYAEVDHQKIVRWRRQASRRAFLPQVSFGIDRNVTDLWHWETGSTTKADDDVLCRGRDALEWDISLTWDLGDLIWNGDQTAIDVRSRLMVELRNEIVDEVTKLYFERIRVKKELSEISESDTPRIFEKSVRLQELTARLDALTGGYFSRSR